MHISPSQIATWRGCPRKWAYSRVRPRSENKYALFGTRVHAILEGWLTTKTLPAEDTPERACAIAGLGLLPMPGTVQAEVPLELEHEGVRYVGFVDVLGLPGDGSVLVLDHKTTGDLKWAKTQEQLACDPQWITYGHWATKHYQAERANGRWLYYRRKPPLAHPVDVTASAQELADRFGEMHETDGRRIAAADGVPPEQLPRVLDHCNAYGGCPYKNECLGGMSTMDRVALSLRKVQARPMTEQKEIPQNVKDLLALPPEQAAAMGINRAEILKYYGLSEQEPAPAPAPAAAPAPFVPPVSGPIVTPPIPTVAQASAEAVAEAPKRRTRADKGKPRGPRNPTTTSPPIDIDAAVDPVVRESVLRALAEPDEPTLSDELEREARIGRLAVRLFAELCA